MRISIFTDPHARSKGPSTRSDDYQATVLSKMRYVIETSSKLDCMMIWCLGDLFHFKDPSRTPYQLTLAMMTLFKETNLPLMITLGNHDLQSSGIHSLSKQPIGLLLQAKALRRIERLTIHEAVPLTITNFDYRQKMVETLLSSVPSPVEGHNNILMTHADITPQGLHGTISYEAISELGYDMVLYGHMHTSWGVHTVGKTKIYSCPPLMRGSISEASTTTTPRFAVLDTADNSIVEYNVPHEKPERIFALKTKADDKSRANDVSEFISQLSATSLGVKPLDQSLLELKGTIPVNLYNRLTTYLESLE